MTFSIAGATYGQKMAAKKNDTASIQAFKYRQSNVSTAQNVILCLFIWLSPLRDVPGNSFNT